jgi:hypothetical protein
MEGNNMVIYPIIKDIKSVVDFEKLKKCNDLCYSWCKRFKINKLYYIRFVHGIYKNPEEYACKLTGKQKIKFLEDCKTMFYAAEVEEILIKQYSTMVYSIMKKLHLDYDKCEDYVTDGFMAIRYATWQYKTYKIKASFTTFVHKSMFMRLAGRIHKEKVKKIKRKKLQIRCISDFEGDDINLESFNTNKDYSANTENIDLEIDKIIVGCSLTDQEAMILRSFVNRRIDVSMWYIDYRKKYINKQLNKPLSRQSIYNHLETVHEKVLNYLINKNMLPDGYIPPKTRRGDFR